MIHCNIKNTDGGSFKIGLPSTLSEVTLSNAVEWSTYKDDLTQWLTQDVEDLEINRTYYLYLISNMISKFLDIELVDVMGFDVSSLVDSEGNLLAGVLVEHANNINKKDFDIESAEVVLTDLYGMIDSVINSYDFKFRTDDFQFEYKGETWTIPNIIRQSFSGQKIFSEINTRQAVEVLQIKKALQGIDTKDLEVKRDVQFSNFLKIIALLARKENDIVPVKENEFQVFIEERMAHFQNIDVKNGYDLVFFLTTSIMN